MARDDSPPAFGYIKRMDAIPAACLKPPIEILVPPQQTAPVVFSSPHSGRDYSPAFVAQSRLDAVALRRSEDSFVDELFGQAPLYGAPLLKALFPRAFVDPNREPFELDPNMFEDHLPAYANVKSPRVAAGLGTIARLVANGAEIYQTKLSFAEADRRITDCYQPYHHALEDLIVSTRRQFGFCIVLDCHSMPSVTGPLDDEPGRRRQADFILGDAHGQSCSLGILRLVEQSLRSLGFVVAINTPYSGGYITRHYGRPRKGVHALQIEINRALYMDEERIRRLPALKNLSEQMAHLARCICGVGRELMAA